MFCTVNIHLSITIFSSHSHVTGQCYSIRQWRWRVQLQLHTEDRTIYQREPLESSHVYSNYWRVYSVGTPYRHMDKIKTWALLLCLVSHRCFLSLSQNRCWKKTNKKKEEKRIHLFSGKHQGTIVPIKCAADINRGDFSLSWIASGCSVTESCLFPVFLSIKPMAAICYFGTVMRWYY